jgi:acyl carrier protein
MRPIFDTVAEIIALTCHLPRDRITADSNLLHDLGIDSLDLLDVASGIDNTFGIALPIDRWLHAIHLGQATSDQYFVMREFCDNIAALVVAGPSDRESSCGT